jgi:hypothetical protein
MLCGDTSCNILRQWEDLEHQSKWHIDGDIRPIEADDICRTLGSISVILPPLDSARQSAVVSQKTLEAAIATVPSTIDKAMKRSSLSVINVKGTCPILVVVLTVLW